MIESTTGASTPVNDAGEPKTEGVTTQATASEASQTPPAQTTEPSVPEKYEFAKPEGFELDASAVDEFTGIAKELKLDQANAQKVADVAVKMMQRQVESHTKLVESWVESTKIDKELGGEKLSENLSVAKKALDTFGTPELRDVLNSTGLGNHPEIIRAFYKAGKDLLEGKFVQGAPKGTEVDPARRMFPSMN
jgi:hypothetical protein